MISLEKCHFLLFVMIPRKIDVKLGETWKHCIIRHVWLRATDKRIKWFRCKMYSPRLRLNETSLWSFRTRMFFSRFSLEEIFILFANTFSFFVLLTAQQHQVKFLRHYTRNAKINFSNHFQKIVDNENVLVVKMFLAWSCESGGGRKAEIETSNTKWTVNECEKGFMYTSSARNIYSIWIYKLLCLMLAAFLACCYALLYLFDVWRGVSFARLSCKSSKRKRNGSNTS